MPHSAYPEDVPLLQLDTLLSVCTAVTLPHAQSYLLDLALGCSSLLWWHGPGIMLRLRLRPQAYMRRRLPRYNALRVQKSGLQHLTFAWPCTPLRHCPRLPCTMSHMAMRSQIYSARSMACHAYCITAHRERGMLELLVRVRWDSTSNRLCSSPDACAAYPATPAAARQHSQHGLRSAAISYERALMQLLLGLSTPAGWPAGMADHESAMMQVQQYALPCLLHPCSVPRPAAGAADYCSACLRVP